MQDIKCVLVGEAESDKTKLLISYTTDRYPTEYVPTVFDNYSTTIMINGEPLTLSFWDTAGQEEYDKLRPLSYPGTDVFVVLFSVAKPFTFDQAKTKWIPEIRHHCPHVPFVLVGNDVRLRNDAETVERLRKEKRIPVSTKTGEKLARELGAAKYIECDAVTQYQLRKVFDEAALVALTETDKGEQKGGFFSNIFSRFRRKKSKVKEEGTENQISVPDEIAEMGDISVEMYINALKEGKEKVYDIRLMVVGAYEVGKTTLTNRLLKRKVVISSRESTNGIDVHVQSCAVRVPSGEWVFDKGTIEAKDHMLRIANLIETASKEKQIDVDDVASVKSSEARSEEPDSPISQDNQSLQQQTTVTEEKGHAIDDIKDPVLDSSVENLKEKMEKSDIDEDRRQEILTTINQAVTSIRTSTSNRDIGKVSIWDFGGQFVFYSTHQVFLSARAIYIIVIDLTKSLGDNVRDECLQDATGVRCGTFKDRLIFWLNSIHTYSIDDDESIPPVILVGTHLDKIKGKKIETVQKFFSDIRKLLAHKPVRFHLIDEDFAIDNTKIIDPRLHDLRKKIFEIASKQNTWGEEIPARWINLENALMRSKSEGMKIISFDKVEQLNQELEVSVPNEKEVLLFLRFQHEIGNIIFFDDDLLRKYVVLQPQWLIDAFKSFITAEEFCAKSATFASIWFEFFDKAVLREELIDYVWQNEKDNCFYDNKKHILNLMERLDILAKPSLYPEITSSDAISMDYYLVPCMLSKTLSLNEYNQVTAGSKATPYLCYEFSNTFLPPAVFHRLLAACMGKWPVVQRKEQLMLFCGCGIFYITNDRCNRLLLSCIQHIIQIRIFHYGKRTDIDAELAVSVRDFITKKLKSIVRLYHRRLPYELSVKCEKADHDSLEGLLNVNDLLKYPCVTCDSHSNSESHAVESTTMLDLWCSDLQSHKKVYGYKGQEVFKDNIHNPELLLQRNAGRHGMVFRKEAVIDGNSFFHAVCDQLVRLNLQLRDHVGLRQEVVAFIKELGQKPIEWIKAHITDDLKGYLKNMCQSGTPVDPIVIGCTAKFLNKKIIIASSSYEADITELREQIVNCECKDDGLPILLGQLYEGVFQSLDKDENVNASALQNLSLKKQIRRNYRYLVQNTDLKPISDVLCSEDIFSINEKELVENAQPNTTEKKNRVLLDLLMKKKEKAFQVFLLELKDMGHEDIVERIQNTSTTEKFNLVDKRKDTDLKEQIKRNYEMLVMDTILEDKVDAFYSEGIFSLTEKQIVENAQPNTVENKNRLFLDIFLKKRNDSAHILMNAFNEEGRDDIVQKITSGRN